ncbi:LysR family transcriptional regulator [Planktomarina temperata]|uniref:LysR family transcriptional regulator n=1 Tax=Planktomarina temperata TaxID=1284658 RepID=UPI0032601309|nr:LysR family transcriptional regulator [Planktomarina temperata]
MRYVEAAGRLGSIAKAAVEVSISQSSITASIDALEASLDYALFVRTPAKGITPTSAGREALQLIRTYLNQTRQFESELQSQGGDDAGLVRIACYATAAPTFLPPILNSITENFPGISVKVMEGNMMAIMDYLENGEVDLVFTYDRHVPPAQAFEPLFSAPPYALISKSDAASQLGSITFKQLSKKPMIMLDLPYTRDYFLELFRARGLEPELSHSTRSSEIAQALVEGDFGYTLLNIQPRTYSAKDSRFRAIPISDSTDVPIFGIATLGNLRQPKNVRSFIKICTQLRDEGVFDGFTVTVPT